MFEHLFYPGSMDPAERRALATQRTAPRHVWVRFGTGDLPGLLIARRPARELRGGPCRWEGLVVFASHNWATGDVRLTQEWLAFGMLRPADGGTVRRRSP
jgi:hypothetical protein